MRKDNDDYDENSEDDEYILEGAGQSLDIGKDKQNQLEEKAKKATCKIKSKFIGTGFFCKIPFNNNKTIIKVLFTNNHILNEESLEIGKTINIIYKGNSKDIKITKDRLVFTDSREYKKGLDYSCIEIFDSDGIEDFYEIFDCKNFSKKEILSVSGYYNNGEKLNTKSGYLDEIKNYKIKHKVDTDHGCSGSPIILTNDKDFKIIGIHRNYIKNKKINLGSHIKDILNHIYEDKYKGNEKNMNKLGNEIIEINW